MAIVIDGQLRGLNGRVGYLVTYLWRGKWVSRSVAAKPTNPRTEKQQGHRMLFKQEVQLAGRMNWVLRETLDAVSAEHGMTPCNYFIKKNQEAFSSDDTKLVVDWSQLVLSEGPVAPVAFDAPVVTDGTTLSITFERNPLHMPSNNFDRVYVYIYCPEQRMGFLAAPVYRRDRRLSVVLPEMFAGHEVQLWGMVQDTAGRWSDTIYIGYGPVEDTPEVVDGTPLEADATAEAQGNTMSQQPVNQKKSKTKKASLREAPGWSVGDHKTLT